MSKKANADEVKKVKDETYNLDIPIPDFTEKSWEMRRTECRLPASRFNIPFSPRKDGIHRPVSNVTLKVPTGGKTWLAVKSASKILNKYLHQNTGFIL